MEARAWQDALRVANEHVPQMAAEVHAEYEKATAPQSQDATNPASLARLYESRGEYPHRLWDGVCFGCCFFLFASV
jgi:hypothetical protein